MAGTPSPASAFARVELRIEDAEPVREGVFVDHAVEILEEEGQRLALVEPRLLRKAAQAAVAVLCHRRVEAAGEAKAFGQAVLPLLRISPRRWRIVGASMPSRCRPRP